MAIPITELDVATSIVKNHNNLTLLDGKILSAIDEVSDELGVDTSIEDVNC